LNDLEAMPLGFEGLEEERVTSIHRLLALPFCRSARPDAGGELS
jgi:hypothetical protein